MKIGDLTLSQIYKVCSGRKYRSDCENCPFYEEDIICGVGKRLLLANKEDLEDYIYLENEVVLYGNTFQSSNKLPKRATKGSAGYDFFANEEYVIPAKGSVTIDSGIRVKLEKDKVLMLYVRSSYGMKYGITMANGTGIVDSDYKENIHCKLVNNSDVDFIIKKGDRYMQGIIMSYHITDDDDTTEVRNGGIGSTGK